MRRIAALLIAMVALAGCGRQSEAERRAELLREVGPPAGLTIPAPASVRADPVALREYEAGQQTMAQSGCLACHQIGPNGNRGPGPSLDDVGARLPRDDIARTLVNPVAPMPSFASLEQGQPRRFEALTAFLAAQGGP